MESGKMTQNMDKESLNLILGLHTKESLKMINRKVN